MNEINTSYPTCDKLFSIYLFLSELESQSWMRSPYGGATLLDLKIMDIRLNLSLAIQSGEIDRLNRSLQEIQELLNLVGITNLSLESALAPRKIPA